MSNLQDASSEMQSDKFSMRHNSDMFSPKPKLKHIIASMSQEQAEDLLDLLANGSNAKCYTEGRTVFLGDRDVVTQGDIRTDLLYVLQYEMAENLTKTLGHIQTRLSSEDVTHLSPDTINILESLQAERKPVLQRFRFTIASAAASAGLMVMGSALASVTLILVAVALIGASVTSAVSIFKSERKIFRTLIEDMSEMSAIHPNDEMWNQEIPQIIKKSSEKIETEKPPLHVTEAAQILEGLLEEEKAVKEKFKLDKIFGTERDAEVIHPAIVSDRRKQKSKQAPQGRIVTSHPLP